MKNQILNDLIAKYKANNSDVEKRQLKTEIGIFCRQNNLSNPLEILSEGSSVKILNMVPSQKEIDELFQKFNQLEKLYQKLNDPEILEEIKILERSIAELDDYFRIKAGWATKESIEREKSRLMQPKKEIDPILRKLTKQDIEYLRNLQKIMPERLAC